MGTPTAGTISGNTPAICVGNGNTLTLSGASAGIGISYQWKSSTTAGGPYTNMGTALTQATGNLTQTTYYVVTVTCSGSGQTSTTPEVAVVVNPLPTPSITPGPTANFCVSGTLTSSAATGNVWSPGGATTPSITASASGNYTVTVTDGNGCTGTSAATAVTISTQPAALSVTPASPAAFCAGGNVNLTASGGSYSATQTMNFGTQAAQNTAGATSSTDYPAPFTAYWGGQRMQMLIRASELTAAGFTAGAVFNGINFPVVSFGTDWPSIISSCQSFMVKFGYTTATTITAFQTLATTVRPAANFTPTVGYNNLLSFSTTPAAWNGTDNVIIETTFSNNITGTSAKSVIQYNSPTTYSSCIQYRADGVTAATAAAGTVVSYTYNARPDFKLMGTQAGQAPFTWSPATGLNTVNGPTVTASPATTQAYTVTATNGACTSTANVTVTVNPLPVINCPGNSSVCINTPAYALNGASPAGGTYSGTGVSGGSFDPAAAGLGAHTITYSYTDGNGCTNTPCTFTITVNPLPVVSCPGNMTGITTTDAAFALAGHGESPAGGTFSGTGVSGGNFDPAVAGAGMHTITYTYTDGNSCGGSCTFTIAVALPPCNGNQVVMKIITDNNAAQLGWEFFDSGNATLASGTLTAADNNTTVTQTVCMSYNPGAGCYTFKLMDSFGDGITGGGWELRTTGGALILRDEFGNGSVSPANPPASASYGSGHSFCLPLGPANIAATECGIFDNLQGNKVYCNKVTGATQYQFEFSNPDAGFIRRIVRTTNYVQFWDMVANPLVLGVHYFARVRTNVAGPVASAHWGSGCEMGLAATVPCSGLIPAPNFGHSCNETRAFNSNSSFIYATPVMGASQYQFRIFNASEGYDETFIRSTYILQLKWNNSVAPPLVNGSTYNVEVNVRVGDTYSGFCASSCTITIDNTGPVLGGELEQTGIGEATLWPNPVRDGQVNLSISGLSAGSPAATAGDPALTPQRITV
ncbi:MAG: hypothetical protein JST38_11970, partial [Bacteroidetes bacterium]|nr:hypothetical protein [Bacteroidota bacterium]